MSLLIATQNMGFSPVDLFMDADLVVKSVIVGLALSSVWVWTIIISFTIKMLGINRKSEAFEREFWGSLFLHRSTSLQTIFRCRHAMLTLRLMRGATIMAGLHCAKNAVPLRLPEG